MSRWVSISVGTLSLLLVGTGFAQTISKVAGTPPPSDRAVKGSYSGDGGPAGEAHLYYPMSVFVDADGNLYIADTLNNRIRRVDPEGVITTVAGNGKRTFSGDGGPATQAALDTPGGLFVDGNGILYIADVGNNRIRRVDPDGTISTIVGTGKFGFSGDGGPAIWADLGNPNSVFLDGNGNIYIADSDNRRIRRVDDAGIITTVAGSGGPSHLGEGGPATQASIDGPRALFVDNVGNLFFADTDNRVRRVDPEGTITTVAGTDERGFSGDGGPAVEARLFEPASMFKDDAGNLYICEGGDHGSGPRVRRVDLEGIIRTVVGSGERGRPSDPGAAIETAMGKPVSVFVDRIGDLYLIDSYYNLVLRVQDLAAPTVLAGTIPRPEVDTTPPFLAATSPVAGDLLVDPAELDRAGVAISFNEPVDLTSIQIRVEVGGQVRDWPISASGDRTIELSATSPAFDTEYRITVSQVTDRAGNVADDVVLTFQTRADLSETNDLGGWPGIYRGTGTVISRRWSTSTAHNEGKEEFSEIDTVAFNSPVIVTIDTTASCLVSESSGLPEYPSAGSCEGCWIVSWFSCHPVQIDVEFPGRRSYNFNQHYERFFFSPTAFSVDAHLSLNFSEWLRFRGASDGSVQGSVNLLNHFDLAHVHSSEVATFTVVRDDTTANDVTAIVESDEEQPVDFALHEVYPNPFNSATLLRFDLPYGHPSELVIYSVSGQKVATVVAGVLPAGRHQARWDGRSDSGHRVGSGVYLARLHSGSRVATRKVLLLR